MIADEVLSEAAVALQQDWGISIPVALSEDDILRLLAARVATLTEKGAEQFYQLMYRLDISEKKLNATIGQPDVAERIAKLIYDRQVQKIISRQVNTPQPPVNEEDEDMRL